MVSLLDPRQDPCVVVNFCGFPTLGVIKAGMACSFSNVTTARVEQTQSKKIGRLTIQDGNVA